MTVDEFIQQRFTDAKAFLEKTDGTFVKAISAAKALSPKGIQLSEIKPTVRLPQRWTGLLETCVDVVMEIEFLNLTANSLNPEYFQRKSKDDVGREATRHALDWVIHQQALLDKVELLIKRTLAVSLPMNKRKFKKQLSDKYHSKIWEGARKKFSAARSGLLHGAGENGTISRSISKNQLWESVVALQIPTDIIKSSAWEETSEFLGQWYKEKTAQTEALLKFLGSVLEELTSELAEQP